MAKKKRKRRHPQKLARPRPQGPSAAAEAGDAAEAQAEAGPSRRAERKEEARRERERRIRQARRRQRTRRLVRWGIVIGVVALIAGIVWWQGRESRELQARAAAALKRLSCTPVEEQEETLPNRHAEPYAVGEGGVPAFGGNHAPGALPSEPKFYQQPVPEESAVHSLEHGYVMIYFSVDVESPLDGELVSALKDLANDETEVIMSPYESLAEPLYLVAWGARQACGPPADADPGDVTLVAEAFIDEWKNGEFAPEAAAT